MSATCDHVCCYVLCVLYQGGASCAVSVYCDVVHCHALCLYAVTGWNILLSCPVSVYWYSDRLGCDALCLFTVMRCSAMFLSVYCVGVWCHTLCLYTVVLCLL